MEDFFHKGLSEESLYDPREVCYVVDEVSPDYCPTCGNRDFYAASYTWVCHWCRPLGVRDIKWGQRGKPTEPYGPYKVQEPRSSRWTPREVLSSWPPDFTPEMPKGPAVGALTLRRKDIENGTLDKSV